MLSISECELITAKPKIYPFSIFLHATIVYNVSQSCPLMNTLTAGKTSEETRTIRPGGPHLAEDRPVLHSAPGQERPADRSTRT